MQTEQGWNHVTHSWHETRAMFLHLIRSLKHYIYLCRELHFHPQPFYPSLFAMSLDQPSVNLNAANPFL